MITLQQGDYVYVRDLSDEEIQRLVDKFVRAGATGIENGNFNQDEYPYLLWDVHGDVWCADKAVKKEGKRQLTIDQVLGTAWQGDGLPPVGVEVEYAVTDEEDELAENWEEGDRLVILSHEIAGSGEEVAVAWNKRAKTASARMAVHAGKRLFRPIRSEEDKAVEEMSATLFAVPDGSDMKVCAEAIYSAIRDSKIPGVKLDS